MEQTQQAREHEHFRQTIVNWVVLASGGYMALLAQERPIPFYVRRLAGTSLALFATLAAVAVMKHYERFRHHTDRAGALRDAAMKADGTSGDAAVKADDKPGDVALGFLGG